MRLGHYWFGSRTNPPVLLILQMVKTTWEAGFVRGCARNDRLISVVWEQHVLMPDPCFGHPVAVCAMLGFASEVKRSYTWGSKRM